VWTLAWTRSGSKPTFSHDVDLAARGQPARAMFVPSIQIAGQVPRPLGSFARTSTGRSAARKRPSVFTLAEV
jgi:hypothetical protein